jgi:coenzyme PQQ precursor peptide PqqA
LVGPGFRYTANPGFHRQPNWGYAAAIRAAQPHDHKARNSKLSNSGVLPEAGNCYLPGTEVKETEMTWTTPTLVEICVGLEINGYLPAEF